MNPNTVEVVDNEPSSSASSTNVGERVDRQITSGFSQKQSIQKKMKNQKSERNASILRDSTNSVVDVQPVNTGILSSEISQDQLVPSISSQFEELIEKEEYGKILEIGKEMSDEEFLEQLCPVVETFDQYNGIVSYLKDRNLVALFFVYGNIEVVKKAIIESKVYDKKNCIDGGDLETALSLVFKEDRYDRFMELLNLRKEITSERDEQCKLKGRTTSFELFVSYFLREFTFKKNKVTLERFFTLHGEELRNKNPDIFDTLCQTSVIFLRRNRLDNPDKGNLLFGMIGQPSLLTPTNFAKGFLYHGGDEYRSNFIKCCWREAIREGLKKYYAHGGEKLWRVMQTEKPDQFRGQFPETEEARIAVCVHFPTKQELEEQWIEANTPGFLKEVRQVFAAIFPTVLTSIVIEYARPTWADSLGIRS